MRLRIGPLLVEWVLCLSICNSRDDNTALTLAKRRIEEEYSIVGINEDIGGFFQLLELAFPSFFKGATQIYTENGSD